jgi:hydroxyacylglutathione hydrolase
MLFRRLYDDSLAQASYLVACQGSKEAIVVDPLRDPAPYLEAARQEGVRITHVTESHVHADFLSGASALADAAGATLLLSGEGEGDAVYRRAAYPNAQWLGDGDTVRVGRLRLDVMHVPGHTPEHLAFLLTDEATSSEPVGLLSGDFLFVGDVGRPDLLERAVGAAGTMEHAARQLHRSLQRLRDLPDFLQVWPGHGAGSACGKALGAVPQSTLGYERRANWAFGVPHEAAFVEQVLAGQPEPPPYFARMKGLNARGGLAGLAPAPTSDEGARQAVAAGALVVDLRTPAEYAAGHLPGSINLPYGKSFLGWAGSVLDPDRDIVLLTTAGARHSGQEAMRALSTIGIDRVRGVAAVDDLTTLGTRPLAILPTIPAESIGPAATGPATVLDVRNGSEWGAGHVPGARHIPLAQLTARLGELPRGGPVIVHCQGGARSAVAASVLQAAGFPDVANAAGGYSAWLRAGNTPELVE